MTTQFLGKEAVETLRADNPAYRLREVDQTAPAGMWQIDAQGGDLLFQFATSADWSAFTTVVTMNDTPGIVVNGTITFSGTVVFSANVRLDDDIVILFGDDSDYYMGYSATDDLLEIGVGDTITTTIAMSVNSSANVAITNDLDVDGTSNLNNTDIDGTLAVDGTTISLDATTSLNIDNTNTSNGITVATATSGVPISIGHTTSETTVNDNLSITGTTILDGPKEMMSGTAYRDFFFEDIKTINGLTSWATQYTITFSVLTDLWTAGFVELYGCGHTSANPNGSVIARWQFACDGSTSTLSASAMGTDIEEGVGPQLQITTSGSVASVQAQSGDGTNPFDGLLHFKIYCPRGAGAQGGNITYVIAAV